MGAQQITKTIPQLMTPNLEKIDKNKGHVITWLANSLAPAPTLNLKNYCNKGHAKTWLADPSAIPSGIGKLEEYAKNTLSSDAFP